MNSPDTEAGGREAMQQTPLRLRASVSVGLRFLAVLAFYLAVAVIVTWPLVTVFSTRFLGHPFGDSYEYARFVWSFRQALETGQSPYFQPWLAYPDGLTAWLLWSIPLQSFPAWLFALALPLPAAMNLAALLRLALNGWSMFFLVRRLTGNRAGALLAGVIFLAYPAFQGQLAAGHTGLLALWPAVLYVCSLQSSVYSLQSSVGRRQAAGGGSQFRKLGTQNSVLCTAVLFVFSTLGSSQHLIYLLLPVTAVFALALFARREWAALRRLTAAVALGGALSLVFLVPGMVEALSAPPWLHERGDITYSADLLGILTPSFQHPLFGRLGYTHTILGTDPFEKTAYIGLTAGLLALAGVWKRRDARWWLLIAFIGWVLSLGPLLTILGQPAVLAADGYVSYVPLPWALYQQLPLFNLVRVPARFNSAVGLAAAVMAGYGWSVVSAWGRAAGLRFPVLTRRALLALPIAAALAASGAVLWEYQLFWTGMPTVPADIPPPVAALAQRDDVRAVFDVPWDHLLAAKEGLYLQTAHHTPMIAGQVTRRTPVSPAKLAVLQGTLDPALLDAAGADVIILHKEWDEGKLEPSLRERLGSPFYEDERFALFDIPDAAAAPGFVAVSAGDIELSDRAESYFYAPDAGGVAVRGVVSGEDRVLVVSLDGTPIEHRIVSGEQAVDLTLNLTEPGYHTLTLALEPPCPTVPAPALRCRSVHVSALGLAPR